jgi:hypothetical protein
MKTRLLCDVAEFCRSICTCWAGGPAPHRGVAPPVQHLMIDGGNSSTSQCQPRYVATLRQRGRRTHEFNLCFVRSRRLCRTVLMTCSVGYALRTWQLACHVINTLRPAGYAPGGSRRSGADLSRTAHGAATCLDLLLRPPSCLCRSCIKLEADMRG